MVSYLQGWISFSNTENVCLLVRPWLFPWELSPPPQRFITTEWKPCSCLLKLFCYGIQHAWRRLLTSCWCQPTDHVLNFSWKSIHWFMSKVPPTPTIPFTKIKILAAISFLKPHQRYITSSFPTFFHTHEFTVWLSSWQHLNFAAASSRTLTGPPLKFPCRGFLHRVAKGEGVKVKVWHWATELKQGEAFVARLLTLSNVAEPGGLWPDLYSERTGGHRGRRGEMKGTGKWLEEKDWDGGMRDGGR